MAQYFDPNVPGKMEGRFTKVAVKDDVAHPNLVIDPTKEFTIEVEWEVFGDDTELYLHAATDQWYVAAYAESIGPGPEIILKEEKEPLGSYLTTNWKHTLKIPAGTLPLPEENPGPGGPSGVYKIVVTVFNNAEITGGYDAAGFHEGPMIKVEDPA